MRKTKILVGALLILTMAMMIGGCDIGASNGVYEYTIDSAITYIEEGGLEIHAVDPVFYEMIGAEDGAKVDVGPEEIRVELYIDGGNINESFFREPGDGSKAFNVSNLYVYIHSDDEGFYNELKGIFKE